jgi:cytochrome c oxidase accessory protein FixG
MEVPDEHDSFRDRAATIDEQGKRKWVFAYKPRGRFYSARTLLSFFYLLLFFGLPFIKYKGEPFLLLNIIERKFVVFGFVFWSQDFYLFGLTMILFVVFIIVFTVAFGRLFCGWACPQTVFMEMVFRKIEYWIDGDAPKQMALKRMPWNAEKIRKRITKWLAFYIMAFLIGNTFLSYIIGVDRLIDIVRDPWGMHVKGFLGMVVFSSVFFMVYLRFREQVCTVVCPYGRLQGVLLDRHSVVVAYDYVRGEPREKNRKGIERKGGDCVDCNLCVHVCPTGIDIRNGTQLDCTNCTACIDACDFMMDKMEKPRGLVRYASESTIADGKPFVITTRLKAYIAVLLCLLGSWLVILFSRSSVDMEIRKVAGLLYQERETGEVTNLYNVMFLNKSHNDYQNLHVRVLGSNAAYIEWVGNKDSFIRLPKEAMVKLTGYIVMKQSSVKERQQKLQLGLYHGNQLLQSEKTNFLAPVSNKK